MIKAFIFDFDGTIVDTETLSYVVFRDAYKEYGVELDLETYSQTVGSDLDAFNPYTHLKTHHNIPMNVEEFRQRIDSRLVEMAKIEPIRPGIMKTLKAAKAAGFKLAIASSSTRDWIDQFIDLHRLGDYFDIYCTRELVKHVKPDPELFLLALDNLNVEAKEAIVFEDSPNGARAAVEAGIHTIVMKTPLTKQLQFGTGHHIIETLEHYELEDLIELALGKVE